MRHFVRFQLIAAVALLAALAGAQPASADQITESVSGCSACNGYTFQAALNSLGSNNYSLSYTITDVSGPSATAQGWSLTLFQNGNDVTYTAGSLSVLSSNIFTPNNGGAYSVMAGKSNNGNGNCNSSLSDSICVTTNGSGSPSVIGLGQSLTFSFNFSCPNCSELSSWDFLSHGTCVGGTGNCYAVTNNGTPVGVPEPPLLALLASEMALMAGAVLVFGAARNRILHRWMNLFRLQLRG
jgi:hypothetical protein